MSVVESIEDLKVLIIDKSDLSTGIVKKSLAALGVEQINISSSITKGMKLISKDTYNIVICEYNLSHEYMGSTLLEKLRAQSGYDTTFVMTSSDNRKEAVLDILQFNPDDLLLKPYTLEDLSVRLKSLCNQHIETIDIRESMKSGDSASIVRLASDTFRTSSNSKNWLIRAKINALEEKKLYKNLETFCRFVLESRNLEWVRASLVKSLVMQKDYGFAIEEAQKAIRMFPSSTSSYLHMAEAYRCQGMNEEASDLYSNVLNLTSRSKDAQKAFSELSSEMGKYDVAVDSYGRLMRLLESTMSETEDAYIELANSTKEQAENDFDIEFNKALTDAIGILKRGEGKVDKRFNLNIHQEIFGYQKLFEEGREYDAKEAMKNLVRTNKKTFMNSSSATINAIITLRTMNLDNMADSLIYNIEHNKDFKTVKKALDRRMKAIRNGGNEEIVKVDRLRREAEALTNQGNMLLAIQKLKEAVGLAPNIPSLYIRIIDLATSYAERFKANNKVINDCKDALAALHGLTLNNLQIQQLINLESKFDRIEIKYREQRRAERERESHEKMMKRNGTYH